MRWFLISRFVGSGKGLQGVYSVCRGFYKVQEQGSWILYWFLKGFKRFVVELCRRPTEGS